MAKLPAQAPEGVQRDLAALRAPGRPGETVQGELLREIERLRREACDNGNINWDEDFAWFCENIRGILLGGTLCTPEERDRVVQAVEEIESRGRYAQAWYEGSIPDESWEPERMACVEEGVYDFLCDMAARFYMAQKEPIPYPEDRKTER